MANLGKCMMIINPIAQSGRGAAAGSQAIDIIRARFGSEVESLDINYTQGPRDAVGISAQSAGYDTVIVLGGDGVIHEAAIGLMSLPPDRRPKMGIIPVGSGNDYARTLNISRDVKTAVKQIFDCKPKFVDVGCCNGVYFVETLSFGLDAAIALATVELRKHSKKNEMALYFEAGIDQLLHHFDSYHYQMTIDNELSVEGDMVMFAVQNGQSYGGGFRITPDAVIDDGQLDVCICDASISLPRAIYAFSQARDGKHLKTRELSFYKGSRITLRFDRRPPCQMDGEEHIADEYDISIQQKALQVLINE